MACPLCNGREKINFGKTDCPECKNSKSRSAKYTRGMSFDTGGSPMSKANKDKIQEILGIDPNVEHSMDDEGVCSCGENHKNLDIRSVTRKLKGKAGKPVTTIPLNLLDGEMARILRKTESLAKSADRIAEDSGTPDKLIPMELFSMSVEASYAAWIEEVKSLEEYDFPTDPEEVQALELGGADAVLNLVAALFLKNTRPGNCSPPLKGLLAVLGVRLRSHPYLAKRVGLDLGFEDSSSSDNPEPE